MIQIEFNALASLGARTARELASFGGPHNPAPNDPNVATQINEAALHGLTRLWPIETGTRQHALRWPAIGRQSREQNVWGEGGFPVEKWS